MQVSFSKYQGAGNDFVMIDNRADVYDASNIERNRWLCDRRFGIGADGLILLENADSFDFRMVYFNSDGRESSMCGNGGRCIMAFAQQLGIIDDNANFIAIDGPHRARNAALGVALQMSDVNEVETIGADYWLDTGSPHYVVATANVQEIQIVEEARKTRYNERFAAEGTNVNFIQKHQQGIAIRTYERGVEDETLACGTGVTAAAICAWKMGWLPASECAVQAEGGQLAVRFDVDPSGKSFSNIWLEGPAQHVFDGTVEI